MTIGFTEMWALAAWVAFVFPQLYHRTSYQKWYIQRMHYVPLAPPAWLFGIVWPLLYAAQVVAIYGLTLTSQHDTWQFITGVVIFLSHMIANKLWSCLFWDEEQVWAAFWLLSGFMIPTSIAFLVCAIPNVIPLVTTSVYLAWIIFAAYLNWSFANIKGGL